MKVGGKIIKKKNHLSANDLCILIIKEALKNYSRDNMSCIVIQI